MKMINKYGLMMCLTVLIGYTGAHVPESSNYLPLLTKRKSNLMSFDFQNIDIRALLQLMSEFSGYNILISDNVTGTLSLRLKEVPWDMALKVILDAKSLSMRHDGNIIRIAPLLDIVQHNKQQQDVLSIEELNEPLSSVTIKLRYAQAAKVQAILSGGNSGATAPQNTLSTKGLLSIRGTIIVDSRTNIIIINDTFSRINAIRALIDKIDIPVKQVLIEARIVETHSGFDKELGMRLLLAGVSGNMAYANTIANAGLIKKSGVNSLSGENGIGTFVNQSFANTKGASLATIFAPNSGNLIGLEIDALELQSRGRTISRPKIMTADFQTASILQGLQIPYQQSSSSGNTNVAFVNATLSLEVTPQIIPDGSIIITTNIKKDSPNMKLQVQGAPSIDTNSVNTQVRIKDNSTILVGGIYIDDQQYVENKIPILGDLPYMGWLFKATTNKTLKKELLIFITPSIIGNENDDGL